MIYLMRHGEIQGSGEKRYVGRTDVPLSEAGKAQARRWHRTLLDVAFTRIVSSDLSRTRETARIIRGDRPLPIEESPALREIDMGEWDGCSMAQIRARHPGAWKARGDKIAGFRPPGGESFWDLLQRSLPAFSAIAEETREDALVIAHAGVNRVLLCHALGIPLQNLFRIRQDYAGLNLLRLDRHWTVTAVNRVPPPWARS